MMDVYVYIQRQTQRDAKRRDFQEGTRMFQVFIISRIIPTRLPTSQLDSWSIPSTQFESATVRVCSLKLNDTLSLLSRSVYMCASLEMTSIFLHTPHILAGSILFISPPRPIFGANLRSPALPNFLPPIVVPGKSFATFVA